MKKTLIICLLLICYTSKAQWKLISTIKVNECVAASLLGNDKILIADQAGNLAAYDSLGRRTAQYSPEHPMPASSLHASNPLEIWVFYKPQQQALVLDRFLTPVVSGPISLSDKSVGYGELIAPTASGDIWLIDRQDFSLKKISGLSKEIIFQTSFDLILKQKNYNFVFAAEYESQLFLVDRQTGIFIFDNGGNLQATIPHTGTTIPGFSNQQLYMLDKGKIVFHHLYNSKTTFIAAPGTQQAASQVIKLGGSNIWFFIFPDHISIWRNTPA